MPVKYIAVNTRSELFAPAVRAFGNIAIVGRAGFGTPTTAPGALIPALGNARLSRVGLRAVETVVQAVLAPLVARQVIDGFGVVIPLLTLLDKDPADLTAEEADEVSHARATRSVDMSVEVVYAGAIHRLTIDLVLKG
ncbi:hypothetical protein TR51_02410 [Kitasatospora griseola]|uniref:Uncharacterized protein n=1 Tax=Kitasatospora griseola TaxID=2064 RepID=A0A0D0PVD1_KITGR|nr:hypothetical protein [Kitasatospora griseola]KIQ66469.1 hypothetical protein TR51_02410 [Kitasatospora griseola]